MHDGKDYGFDNNLLRETINQRLNSLDGQFTYDFEVPRHLIPIDEDLNFVKELVNNYLLFVEGYSLNTPITESSRMVHRRNDHFLYTDLILGKDSLEVKMRQRDLDFVKDDKS